MLGGKLRPSEIKEDKDYRIKEGERINTDITAHAATLALGLIYLKTGNRSISSRLDVPTTFHQLEYVRADLLLLRVLSRSLILWEEIEATSQWVTSQIPSVVTDLLNAAPKDRAKFLGPRGYNSAEARLPIARQVWMYMITGSCFAIGLKFAGSADADAQRVLRLYAIHVLSARPADFDQSPNILTSCALVCLNALCMVMAGTGDLPTMRLILRFKKEMHRSYGSSMSLNMGLGLLFVGSGMCSLSTSNEAIAALICSFYPMFPENPTDNRYHLQAFRHLFVLALESRTVIPRETDGGAAVSVPLIITMRNGCTRKVVAPCVLPELMYMKMISVDSPRYHPIHIPVTPDTRLTRLCALVVQRRTGFLPYRDDPNGIRRASHPKLLETSQRAQLMRMVRAYTLDATLLAYAETLLGRAEENESFIAILSECLASGTPELLSSYLAINHTLKMARTTPCIHSLQNLRLARAFYAHRRICEKPPLMLQSYLDYVHQQVSSALISPSPNLDSEIVQSLRSVYFFGGAVGPNKDVQAIRDAYAHHTEQLPPISAMSRLATEFSSLSPDTLLSVMDSVTGVPIL
ncbi:hypothetical protein SARC_00427 [Sphaeroforma arctica JP610]|uniref:Uncharacterized protein n=1 Tax=Sphaeroforma arctica JP610 TaxID=667725 RepID=A0A0L0GEK2_9EUKA|nr:hypothetical protein SARC_00427 [Sphaeroforma arctica JP610]KNC87445.1 hypothetical protein SARC_00427 [Sphaeroforma arctica JP610]|eukprot:XP_014161347.1 hypothetical protein SARC_00427 [Sphaeroforma arctica JP610]